MVKLFGLELENNCAFMFAYYIKAKEKRTSFSLKVNGKSNNVQFLLIVEHDKR
jgi:hypothetical protein